VIIDNFFDYLHVQRLPASVSTVALSGGGRDAV
jgi:hypothetical protein